MLYKHYDNMIIGHNYLSLIFGLELLRNKKHVLILDDESTSYGPLFERELTQNDVEFLNIWGEDHNVAALSDLAPLLQPKPVRFVINGEHLLLGRGPSENYTELCRKFPELFVPEKLGPTGLDFTDNQKAQQFDDTYRGLCRRLSQVCFHFQAFENFSVENFLSHYPKHLRQAFEQFKTGWQKGESLGLSAGHRWRSFLYATRGHYHKLLERSINERDLFQLFLSLLSPLYQLDHLKLREELLNSFQRRGGSFKRTTVREWLFDKSRPWSLELSSFEGIIHPRHISFFGGHPSHLPLKFKPKAELFMGVSLFMQIKKSSHEKQAIFEALPRHKCVLCHHESVGSDKSLWILEFSASGDIKATSFVRWGNGMKVSFHRQDLIESLERMLQELWPGFRVDKSVNSFELERVQEVWGTRGATEMTTSDLSSQVKIIDGTDPKRPTVLKDVSYYGPSQMGSHGLLSTLMNMRESSIFI